MSRETKEELRRTLAAEARRQQRAVDALDEAVADRLGVNRTDLRCLDVLMERESATPGQLATALGLTSGSVTTMLDRLERLGYVRRQADPDDRRKLNVAPTPKAVQTAMSLYEPIVRDGAGILGRYTAEQLEVLIDYTRRDRALQEQHAARIRALTTR